MTFEDRKPSRRKIQDASGVAYYDMPEIYRYYREDFERHYATRNSGLFRHVAQAWREYIQALDVGVDYVGYKPSTTDALENSIEDHYAITCDRKFLLLCIRLGVTIT